MGHGLCWYVYVRQRFLENILEDLGILSNGDRKDRAEGFENYLDGSISFGKALAPPPVFFRGGFHCLHCRR